MHPEAVEVLPGQVDSAGGIVLGHVLHMLDDLQRRADPVRQLDPVRGADAEDTEHHVSHRIGGQGAVTQQVIEGVVAGDQLVLPVGRDEPAERLRRQTAFPDGRCQRLDDRECGRPAPDSVKIGFQRVEQCEPVAARLVTDVVDEAGESVDGEQVLPLPGRQDQRRHREVLGGSRPQHILG